MSLGRGRDELCFVLFMTYGNRIESDVVAIPEASKRKTEREKKKILVEIEPAVKM